MPLATAPIPWYVDEEEWRAWDAEGRRLSLVVEDIGGLCRAFLRTRPCTLPSLGTHWARGSRRRGVLPRVGSLRFAIGSGHDAGCRSSASFAWASVRDGVAHETFQRDSFADQVNQDAQHVGVDKRPVVVAPGIHRRRFVPGASSFRNPSAARGPPFTHRRSSDIPYHSSNSPVTADADS